MQKRVLRFDAWRHPIMAEILSRRGDLDLIQRQHIDQGRRRPVDARDPFGQGQSNIPLGLGCQSEENVAEQRRDLGWRRIGFTQRSDLQQKALTIVGTAAMIWVGGQIVVHGLHVLGQHQPYEWIHHMAEAAAQALPAAPGVAAWVTTAFFDGILGLMLGLVLIPVANHVITPAIGAVRGALGRA